MNGIIIFIVFMIFGFIFGFKKILAWGSIIALGITAVSIIIAIFEANGNLNAGIAIAGGLVIMIIFCVWYTKRS